MSSFVTGVLLIIFVVVTEYDGSDGFDRGTRQLCPDRSVWPRPPHVP